MKIMTEVLKLAEVYPQQASKLAQKLHRKKEELELIRKSVISEKAEVNEKERSVIHYISTATKDRDGESLLPEGVILDNFNKNPIVLYGHDYHSIPIGKSAWVKKDDKGLLAKTIFGKSEFADQIYKAYTEDVGGLGPLLNAWSVGFIPIDWEDVETKGTEDDMPNRIYKKWEMIEYSGVPIPSNPEALSLAYRKGLPERLEDDLREDIDELKIEIEDDEEIEIEVEDEKKEADIVTKPETTDNYHRIPVSDGHDDHEIVTKVISDKEGIKALYCVTCKEIITYLFDVEKWSMEEAREWVDEHKMFEGKMVIEIDELSQLIDPKDWEDMEGWELVEEGYLSEDGEAVTMYSLEEVTNLVRDIRSEIAELKEGRVLSTKNRELVRDTIDALDKTRERLTELYDATEPSREDREEEKTIEIEPEEKEQGITPEQVETIVSSLITPEVLDSKIKESVRIAVTKLRGKVE